MPLIVPSIEVQEYTIERALFRMYVSYTCVPKKKLLKATEQAQFTI